MLQNIKWSLYRSFQKVPEEVEFITRVPTEDGASSPEVQTILSKQAGVVICTVHAMESAQQLQNVCGDYQEFEILIL